MERGEGEGDRVAGVTLVEQTFCLSFGVSLIVDWGGLLLLLLIAGMILRKERRWIERGLLEEVRRLASEGRQELVFICAGIDWPALKAKSSSR